MRTIILSALLIISQLAAPREAHAAEISWHEVGSTSAAICEVVITGAIAPGDEFEFQRGVTSRLARNCASIRVHVHSPGGHLQTALKIGDQIHLLQAETVAPKLYLQNVQKVTLPRNGPRSCPNLPGEKARYEQQEKIDNLHFKELIRARQKREREPRNLAQLWTFDPSTGVGDARCICASACFFIWAAGSERVGDVVQIHRPYFDKNAFSQLDIVQAQTAYKQLMEDARSYLLKVEVPESIIARMFAVPSNQTSYLTNEELAALQTAPYLAELKTAKCGEELKLDDLPAVLTLDYCGLPSFGPYENYPELTFRNRCLLTKQIRRIGCWQRAQPELRRTVNAAYLKKYGSLPAK